MDTIRDVIINLKLKTDLTDSKVSVDLSGARKEVKEWGESATDAVAKVQDAARKTGQAAESAARQASDAMTKVEDASQKVRENNVRLLESYQMVADGAFTAARGIALTFASSEENAEKLLQKITAIQGAFDLFRGSIQIIKGVSDALSVARAATAAATAATLAAAEADAIETGTSLANAAANTAQGRAQGGVASAAGAAAARTGGGLFGGLGGAVGAAAVANPVGAVVAVASVVAILTALGMRWVINSRQRAESERGNTVAGFTGREAIARSTAGVNSVQDAVAAQQAIERAIKAQAFGVEQQAALYGKLNEIVAEKGRLEAKSAQDKQAELQTMLQQAQVAKQILDAEKQRVTTLNAAIGALSQSEQNELTKLLDTVEKGGSLNKFQLERFGQLGGSSAQQFAQGEFSKLGEATGIAGRLDALLPANQAVADARAFAILNTDRQNGETDQQAVARLMQDLTDASKAASEAQAAAVDALIKEQKAIKLRAELQRLDIERGAALEAFE